MNLTWHIVKKDLRALKWPLLVWTLLIVAKLGVGVALLTSVGTINADWFANWFVRMDIVAKVFAGLECVSFVLVAAVIYEDLLVGTTAFWMTRPISGARLLRAKMLGIGLIFFVLPVLVTLPWWLGCGYGLREIVWATLETLVVQGICVLLGLLWSVVTDGFARFLLWTLVLLCAVPAISAVINLHISTLKVEPTPELLQTRVCLAIALAVLAILTVNVHQFLTRQTGRSVVLLATAAGLIVVVGFWWPWNWQLKSRWDGYMESQAEGAARAEQLAEPTGLKFTVEGVPLMSGSGILLDRLNLVRTKFSVTGIPGNRVLLPQGTRYTVQWADGEINSGNGFIRQDENPFRLYALQSLGLLPGPTQSEAKQHFTASVNFPAALLPRAHAEQPTLTVKSVFRLLKFRSAATFPLEPGARILTEATGERVAHVETRDGRILVTYVKSRPDFVVGDKLIYPYPRVASPYSVYGLVNQAAEKFDLGRTQLEHKARIASVEVSLQVVAFGDISSRRKNAPPEAWLRNAELIRQTFAEEVRFSHELAAGRFPSETASP